MTAPVRTGSRNVRPASPRLPVVDFKQNSPDLCECLDCEGAGVEHFDCGQCKGDGYVAGFLCDVCNGEGFTEESCTSCDGTGMTDDCDDDGDADEGR